MDTCSFCGEPPGEDTVLIKGKSVAICGKCIVLCGEVIAKEGSLAARQAFANALSKLMGMLPRPIPGK